MVDSALDARAKATRALLAKVELYRGLFTKDVVVDPKIEEDFDSELQRRNSQKIPPGKHQTLPKIGKSVGSRDGRVGFTNAPA